MEFINADLVAAYQATDEKPDNSYSILPTVLALVGDIRGRRILDLGCGSGFFTEALARQGAQKVTGIDISANQLALAPKHPKENVEYQLGDIFQMQLPQSEVVVAPFVLNYAKDVERLADILRKMADALSNEGKLVAVVDLPNHLNHTKFGARKSLARKRDGEPIKIELFRQETRLCELRAIYYLPETIDRLLLASGFRSVTWCRALVHPNGIQKYGADFWKGYTDDPELGYVVALK
jgi:trans-aconitate methyltransferase